MPGNIPKIYAELHAISNFSFLRGASHPEELVSRAHAIGYHSLALTDECSLAGLVRAHIKARELGFRLIAGSEFNLCDGTRLVLLATQVDTYGTLCRLISRGRQRTDKGEYRLTRTDIEELATGCIALLIPRLPCPGQREQQTALGEDAHWFKDCFDTNGWIGMELHRDGQDRERLRLRVEIGRKLSLPLVACGNVHLHQPRRQRLQDVLNAIRQGVTLTKAGISLHPNGGWYLHHQQNLVNTFPPALLEQSLAIAERCHFNLDQLCYEYPREHVPRGSTPYQHLRRLTVSGMQMRWPGGAPQRVRQSLVRELELIRELTYEAYFLTVHDIVCYARNRGILCQGRGSAANSAVCYCLGITEVDPARMNLLFERFISRERNEPPDIDVDFEHERREEVMQYIYRKYGRDHAALTATVVSYRPKSAIRDVGKVLGFATEQIERLSKNLSWWDGNRILPERIREADMDPDHPQVRLLVELTTEIIGFPRHLSQHTGGFVICHQPLDTLVPIENAAMPDRTIIQWDKNDIDALGLLKVDCLALGMLSAIHRCFDLIRQTTGKFLSMATVPAGDDAVFEMISHADTIGVFQIESRAQMAMLPRLKPENFYDLVIEVAIVRPGPIQGDMVHPYLKRRQGLEPAVYPSPEVRQVLERTLGIPIFQEQVIKLAMVAAGFSPGEADGLRRSMAAWRRHGGLEHYHQKLIRGMMQRGYDAEFADRIYNQILGFGEYGFPESHAASFALLVYVSAWMKCHYPAAFTCALLNSQPMGFYAPAQLVQDARSHGVEVRPVDINASDRDCTLESSSHGPVLRLGLRLVRDLSHSGADCLVNQRLTGPYKSVADVVHRTGLHQGDLAAIAACNAFGSLGCHRHGAMWKIGGVEPDLPLLKNAWPREPEPMLRPPGVEEDLTADYTSLGLTLGPHPLALLRNILDNRQIRTAERIRTSLHGMMVRVAGIVISRQRPSNANNVAFVTLEDETGNINLVVWKTIAERQRHVLTGARLMAAFGQVQREGEVIHIIVRQLRDYSDLLGVLTTHSRDFK